ncbi:MAG TPA: SLC13 family permease [Verrucomicrobiae bacterium]|nr:SLC13 family permease [Verrucomicrobiae bacterium]
MVSQIGLSAIFALTALAIIVRPRGIAEGWFAIAGALAALATGLVSLAAARRGILVTLDVLALFTGLLLLAGSVAAAGLLDWLARTLVAGAGGRPRRLLPLVAGACAVVTATLSNDACVLLLAPPLLRVVRELDLPPMPFVLAIAFVANSASLILPTGNPVNLLILDHARVTAAAYLVEVTPAALVGTLCLLAGIALAARRLPRGPVRIPPRRALTDRPLAWVMLGAVVLLVGLDTMAAELRVPLGIPTLVVGAAAAVALWMRRGGVLRALRGSPWGLLPLVAGLAVLGSGLGRLAWLGRVSALIAQHGVGVGAGLAAGAATAILAAVLNNLPAALAVSAGLHAAHHLHQLALPVIAGADLGPNLLPMGSLSTLLLFAVARRQGIGAGWRSFLVQASWAGPLSLVPLLLLGPR